MGKTIRVEDETYEDLEKLILHRETFNNVIQRLLKVYHTLSEVSVILGPGHFLKSEESPAAAALSKKEAD